MLHPPYTAWHLSYVVLGASLAPRLNLVILGGTLVAFFLAVGIAAHTLDEAKDRPLGTGIPTTHLVAAAVVALAAACALGAVGTIRVGPGLVAFIAVGAFLVPAYDLELVGGRIHNDLGFAAAWGAFPVLTAYFAQARTLGLAAALGAAGAMALSIAQRRLSNAARGLRRQAVGIEGRVTLADGSTRALTGEVVLGPLEGALKALCWATVALAVGFAVARLG